MYNYLKILNEIIEAYYNNEWPEYFEDDVDKIFKREGITKGYKAEPTAATCFGCNCPKMEKLEAEPIKRGRWIEERSGNALELVRYHCSVCGKWQTWSKYHYCPNCGARMDKVEE